MTISGGSIQHFLVGQGVSLECNVDNVSARQTWPPPLLLCSAQKLAAVRHCVLASVALAAGLRSSLLTMNRFVKLSLI